MLDVYKIRKDFPILGKKVNNTDLIYFDNAATSQTPNQVITKKIILIFTEGYTLLVPMLQINTKIPGQ